MPLTNNGKLSIGERMLKKRLNDAMTLDERFTPNERQSVRVSNLEIKVGKIPSKNERRVLKVIGGNGGFITSSY